MLLALSIPSEGLQGLGGRADVITAKVASIATFKSKKILCRAPNHSASELIAS